MKRTAILIVIMLGLVACGKRDLIIDYTPNPSKVGNPKATIKRILQEQPPSYAYVPSKVEVTNAAVKIFMADSSGPSAVYGRPWWTYGPGGGSNTPTVIYYKNIGKMKIVHMTGYNVYQVEIIDRAGNYLYGVYTFEEVDAKRFSDAMSRMMR